MKNAFLSKIRKEKHLVVLEIDGAPEAPVAQPNQIDSITLKEVRDQVTSLPTAQRIVLELVGEMG